MPAAMRPGDVLADRYRLVDLLSEARGGRFWRAWDQVLARHVAIHLIHQDDTRAPGLMDAARRSATLLDPRLLRVLDADRVGEVCYVVNEWGEGESLDQLLVDGPLAPRRAAWIVSEVGGLLVNAHGHGISHGRLVPENVLVDEGGAVKVIGLGVDAALHGLPAERTSTDVVDLAGVLYAALTGKWPGQSRSDLTPAPEEHGRPLRPRQVRAGVPRALDGLCDEVLNPYPGHGGHGYDSAQAITAALVEYVGDPAAVAAAEMARHRGFTGTRLPGDEDDTSEQESVTQVLPVGQPDDPAGAAPGAGPTDGGAQPPGEQPDEGAEEGPAQPSPDETLAGVPVFYDQTDEVGWMNADGKGEPPPPPALEEPPERPLFAPDPPDGRPSRRPRHEAFGTGAGGVMGGATGGATGPGTSGGYWPWDTTGSGSGSLPFIEEEPADDSVPGRNWLRIAAGVALLVVVLVAMAFAFDRGRSGTPFIDDEEPTQTPVAEPTPVPASAADFDPQGDPPEENSELAPLVVDGDPSTTWRTNTYRQNFGPGGLKTGVGLLLDLGEIRDVREVEVTLRGAPTEVELLVSEETEAPEVAADLRAVTSGTADEDTVTLAPEEPARARWVVVWLTSLPTVDGGFRGVVAEVEVRA